MTNCIKGLHGVTESTLHFFKDFEEQAKSKQTGLILELEANLKSENDAKFKRNKEERKQKEGYIPM